MQSFKKFAAIVLVGSALLTSCKKDNDATVNPLPTPPAPAQPTVVGIAQSNANFSILVAAVQKAGLVNTLSNPSAKFTVFAPTNAAFQALNITEASIAAITSQADINNLAALLTYHVLGAEVRAANVPVSDAVATVNTKNIFAARNANGVSINGVRVTTADLLASNGVVHVINKVLMPPTQTIAQIVIDGANFSLLERAVITAGLATTLSGPGKFTVFAPVNAGFPAAYDTEAEINAAPAATMLGIVGSHAFATNISAADLTAGVTPATVNPATTLTIGLTGTPNVKITNSSATPSGITSTDIIATNGIIHVIDKVLL
jgi:uncharacterized surface protein with fasciclin (FAS1) repeats